MLYSCRILLNNYLITFLSLIYIILFYSVKTCYINLLFQSIHILLLFFFFLINCQLIYTRLFFNLLDDSLWPADHGSCFSDMIHHDIMIYDPSGMFYTLYSYLSALSPWPSTRALHHLHYFYCIRSVLTSHTISL